jgi:hypothetical protein
MNAQKSIRLQIAADLVGDLADAVEAWEASLIACIKKLVKRYSAAYLRRFRSITGRLAKSECRLSQIDAPIDPARRL